MQKRNRLPSGWNWQAPGKAIRDSGLGWVYVIAAGPDGVTSYIAYDDGNVRPCGGPLTVLIMVYNDWLNYISSEVA